MEGAMNIKRLLSFGFVIALASSASIPLRAQATDTSAKTANPELVGELSKELGSTPAQAEGAAGALFNHAKAKLDPADWSKVAGAVPGIAGLLKAAPAATGATGSSGNAAALGALAGAAGLGDLASLAGSFNKLGLKPEMIAKAVPILTNYVSKSGGAAVGQILAGVLK
jgi:uncharacterized protein VcgC/VcgE DUF2780